MITSIIAVQYVVLEAPFTKCVLSSDCVGCCFHYLLSLKVRTSTRSIVILLNFFKSNDTSYYLACGYDLGLIISKLFARSSHIHYFIM